MVIRPLLIVLFPLLSFWVIMLFGRMGKLRGICDKIAVGAIALSFLLSYTIYRQAFSAYNGGEEFLVLNQTPYSFMTFTNPETGAPLVWKLGFWIDSLTAMMLMVVTIVSLLVHIFSLGYMKGEENYGRFFGFLSLFSFSMLLLVLTDNLFILYCCWELVGISSFLLIGFYVNRASAAAAAKKAFLTNRVGDLGFAIGLFIIYSKFHTFSYIEVFERIKAGEMSGTLLTITSLFLFCGAVGKSAQFPLHIWLPDAMEGPTPVSALIHAATMVAAGVYMVARLFPIFTPDSLLVVAYIGTFTALMAATIAITQFDIKRVLAYSTLSQLGYMMAGLGVTAYTASMFHLTTHAFFKALLFLCSGSVILALHHEQDMRKMGGLWRKAPITCLTMLIGCLAISGIPFLSGFYSKDMILAGALHFGMEHPQHMLLPIALFVAAGMTAFYMFRLFFMTFTGTPRDHHAFSHAHESPWVVTIPLILLALLSISSGWEHVGLGGFFKERVIPFGSPPPAVSHTAAVHGVGQAAFAQDAHEAPTAPVAHGPVAPSEGHSTSGHATHDTAHTAHVLAMTLSVIGSVIAIFISALCYWERFRVIDPARGARMFGKLYDLSYNKYYVDEFYDRTLYSAVAWLRGWLARFDLGIIDGIVNGTAHLTARFSKGTGIFDLGIIDGFVNWFADFCQDIGQRVRRVETGVIQNYILRAGGAVGVIVIVWIVVKSLVGGA